MSTDLWQSLVDAEWAVVEEFELDGHRFLRLRPSLPALGPSPELSRTRPLSEREEQVLAAVAMGHANKLIAYDLGVSESTVSAYVRRAAAKLGTTSRVGLVRAYRVLSEQRPTSVTRAA